MDGKLCLSYNLKFIRLYHHKSFSISLKTECFSSSFLKHSFDQSNPNPVSFEISLPPNLLCFCKRASKAYPLLLLSQR